MAIKDDLKFRLDFFKIYSKFNNWTSAGIDEIYERYIAIYIYIKEDFKDDEEAQAILCERFVNNVDINDSEFPLKLKMSVDAFEKCVTEINNKKYGNAIKIFSKLYLEKSIEKVYERAQEKNLLSEEMYLGWLEFLDESNEDNTIKEKKQSSIINHGLKAYPNSAKLLYQYLLREMSSSTSSSLISKFEEAIKQIKPNGSYELWGLYLNYLKEEMKVEHIGSDEVNNKFKNTSSTIRLDDANYENFVLSKYLEWSKETFDILIHSKQRSLQFFEKCIEIELLSSKKKEDSANIDIVIDNDDMDIDEEQNTIIFQQDNKLNKLITKILRKDLLLLIIN
ncbi:hypothetical protein LY90DRAFT_500948 [Neocallimastix californiae]|uniref:U3 small nucleolar RNA-associated protein 6 homolog C-terminal domain-containing protein n=1 Tax=Neocallimastix californiae TaxID=1754190 RepID=A0A1Y2F4B4_9FUNG|nr:hypothetical protein LY90DRAFT_500948 [Neocallimastix californiae]|eukprot:ORY78758.1 hypothetical protein LY90DRAFT_500948 [Neocallimastix californiae]